MNIANLAFEVKSVIIKVAQFFLALLLYPVNLIVPRDDKKIIFGAWCGWQFSDNPKYFMLYLLSLEKPFKCYWVGASHLRRDIESVPNVHYLRRFSIITLWHVMTSRWFCCNIKVNLDITKFPTFGKVKQLNFWHGTAFKGVSYRNLASKPFLKRSWFCRLIDLPLRFYRYAYPQECFASFSSSKMVDLMPYECPEAFASNRAIAAGTPRMDYLIAMSYRHDELRAIKAKYAKLLGLPAEMKWYLYMPTWRKGLQVNFSFLESNRMCEFQKLLKSQNAILIEKQHPQVLKALKNICASNNGLYYMSAEQSDLVDVQELLIVADRLITDYSSCFYDFEVMNRPVIHYAYDYDWYVEVERGVEYRLEDVAAGPVAKTETELLHCMALADNQLLKLKGPSASTPLSGETGHACETFARWVGLVKG